jgi:hypothetical protein
MDYAPWVLVLDLKDIYALNNKIDWERSPNERRDMLAANFMGDSLRDRLDPALRNNT